MFFYSRKSLILLSVIIILFIILAYLINLNSIPDSIILFEDTKPTLETIAGIKLNEIKEKDVLQAATRVEKNNISVRK